MNNRYEFWRSRQLRQGMDNPLRRPRAEELPLEPSFAQLTPELLYQVFQARAAQGDRAPGPDGVWLRDLNLLAHVHLDVPLHRDSYQPSVHRFVDNPATVTSDESEGLARMAEVAHHLEPLRMQLKHPTKAVDLRKEAVDLLGVQLQQREGKMRYQATPASWILLEDEIQGTWNTPDPAAQGMFILRGWIESHAATFENRNAITDQIYEVALRSGHHEIPREDVRRMVHKSQDRWLDFYGKEMQRLRDAKEEKVSQREGSEGLSQAFHTATRQSDPLDCPF